MSSDTPPQHTGSAGEGSGDTTGYGIGSTGSDPLSRLLAKCLEQRDRGVVDIPFEEICRDHPELIDEVRASVNFAAKLPGLQAVGATGDPLLHSMLADRYRIDNRLGSGAMGVVYAATDLDLGRRVAIKVVHTRFLEASQAMTRFDREAAALAAISHDSVVTIHDRGVTEEGAPFLVMELIDGIPCSEVLQLAERHKSADSTEWLREECGVEEVKEASLVRQMVRWGASLASGLEAAHAAGVYHRDVKPSNIMIRRDGRAVLLDFGIASMESDETLTRADSAVGTPAYMAPETLLGGKDRARPSLDVYGLAATLYHLLTLEAPYRGSAAEILTALATREPLRAEKVRPGLPRDAQAILDHGMARSPGQRYESPGAMEKDLRALLAFQPVSVNPTTRATRAFRRLRRSKLAMGAILATLLFGVFLAVEEVSAIRAAKRKRVHDEVYLHVPANTGLVNHANRVIADAELRDEVGDVFDRLVASGHQEVVARTLRASFRLDHSDAAGAKEDTRAMASILGTTYAVELANRYGELSDSSRSALDLNLKELPTPEAPLDHFLAGYHAIRTNRILESVDLLQQPGLDAYRYVRELRALLTTLSYRKLVAADDGHELTRQASQLMELVTEIEVEFGSASAMSNHLAGVSWWHQRRYETCIERGAQCFELAPSSHVAFSNVADAARMVGAYDLALTYVGYAQRVVPGYLQLDKIESEIEVELGNFDRAREILSSAAFREPRDADPAYLFALARAELAEAQQLFASDPDGSKAAGRRAQAALESIEAGSGARDELLLYARAYVSGSSEAVLHELLAELATRPLSKTRLRSLHTVWPHDSPDPTMSLLGSWVTGLLYELDRQAINLTLTLSSSHED